MTTNQPNPTQLAATEVAAAAAQAVRMHRCPFCCAREIAWPRLVCTRCWPTLPDDIRQALIATPTPDVDSRAWGLAVDAALDWMRFDKANRLAGIRPRKARRVA